jgi:hypothetical protein
VSLGRSSLTFPRALQGSFRRGARYVDLHWARPQCTRAVPGLCEPLQAPRSAGASFPSTSWPEEMEAPWPLSLGRRVESPYARERRIKRCCAPYLPDRAKTRRWTIPAE